MFSFGGNKSDSQASTSQEIFNPQAFSNFYQTAGNQFQRMNPFTQMGFNRFMPMVTPQMRQASQYGRQGAQNMAQGGAVGDTSGVRDNLYSSLQSSMENPSSMGRMYEDIVGGSGNTYIDPLIDSMRTAAGERGDTRRNYNAMEANTMGQSGGSRHAMQNAMTDRGIDQDLNLAENQLRAGAYDTDLNWKMDIARQADLGRGQAQDRAMNILGQADQNRQFGMNYQPTQQQLNMGQMAPWLQSFMPGWQNMQMYANAMGDPTVLTSGQQKGSSGGFGFSGGSQWG